MIYFCALKGCNKERNRHFGQQHSSSISPSAQPYYFLPQTQKPISNALPLAINSLLIVKADTFAFYRVSTSDGFGPGLGWVWIGFESGLVVTTSRVRAG